MSKPKFKVGDRVIIKNTRNRGRIISCTSRYINTSFVDFIYSIDTDRYHSYRENELELVNCIYTGIELLQAIKDGVFKDGDEFNILHKDKFMDKVRVAKYGGGLTLRYEGGDTHGIVVGIQVITNNHVLFTPIKKEPINIVKANHSTSAEMPIEIMGVTDIIKVNVRYKDNKTTVTLPSGVRGVAKCCTEDKFDMLKGARLAFSRAIKKQLIKDIDKVIEKYM